MATVAAAATSTSTRRGAFILFEGIDRCGKTTQSKRLVDALVGASVPTIHMRFPDRTTAIGKIINAYLSMSTNLDDRATHLLFAANRWECREQILEHLKAGTTVVMDRYAFSGVAFSAAKGLDLEWCKVPDAGLPAPDVVLQLELSIEEAEQRGEFGQERYERRDFQQKVTEMYTRLRDDSWSVVTANKERDELHQVILEIVKTTLRRVQQSTAYDDEMRVLWPHLSGTNGSCSLAPASAEENYRELKI